MELEFDKEMDAILRRARDGRGVLVGDDPPEKTKHIDADSIAAFVEKALPAKTRTLYMEHFADCDRCRRILSQSMLFASEADVKAASVVSPIVAETAIPWYQKLFRMPNLAMAMGALVLVFGGLLSYIVIQNRQSDTNASVAQIKENETQKGGPFANDEAVNQPAANATAAAPALSDTAANAAAPAANALRNPIAAPSDQAPEVRGITLEKSDTLASGGESPDKGLAEPEFERAVPEPAKPALKSAPLPAPTLLGGVDNDRESKKEVDDRLKDRNDSGSADSVMRKQAEAPRGRDVPPAPSISGPARSGPINMQSNQIQNQIDMPVTRSVGGKTFNNRNGAWYDSTYKNQATMNFRRGTDEYKKLDSGLRGIADNLGGTVVLVWKGKAYRVQ